MADVEISYNGNTIVSMSDSGTEYLDTKGLFMTDNVTVNYTKSGGSSEVFTLQQYSIPSENKYYFLKSDLDAIMDSQPFGLKCSYVEQGYASNNITACVLLSYSGNTTDKHIYYGHLSSVYFSYTPSSSPPLSISSRNYSYDSTNQWYYAIISGGGSND